VSDSGHDVSEQDAYSELQILESDVNALNQMLPPSSLSRKTLADVIFSKMEVYDDEPTVISYKNDAADPAAILDPRIVELYTKVGLAMRGKGPLVKPMKILPTLSQWAPCLRLTNPEQWSPYSCRMATKVFISNMKPEQARIYLHFVLLNAVRVDIANNNKLNVHYYEALIRAMYKPAAFFKGIVFPLLETGCTLKEAAIIASVLAKKTIPSVHLGAAIINIAKADFSGPRALFLRVLIDKKKDLPYKVIDEVVFHFIRVSNSRKHRDRADADKLPVLWHQSLLAFCQRYASNLTPDQKDSLLDVIRANPHHQIGPEARRELEGSRIRGSTDITMS
jgi:essential nuclear protein 1